MSKKSRAEEISPAEKYLLDEIKETRDSLAFAYASFEYVTDPDMIDSCIYQMNAAQIRYNFLLERARDAKLVSECVLPKYKKMCGD